METKNTKPNNPSAFPPSSFALEQENSSYYYEKGMTLRDYFANSAMQAYIADHLQYKREGKNGWTVEDMTDSAYVIADAMLKQREL